MPPTLDGYRSLTSIARETGSHQRLVMQMCKFFSVRTRKVGPVTFVRDDKVDFLKERLAEWDLWHKRCAAISRC